MKMRKHTTCHKLNPVTRSLALQVLQTQIYASIAHIIKTHEAVSTATNPTYRLVCSSYYGGFCMLPSNKGVWGQFSQLHY